MDGHEDVSFRSFPNSSCWWWFISSVFLIRISCHKTTLANGYYGTWLGWEVSISVLPLTISHDFMCISLKINDVDYFFMCLFSICIFPLVKCLFRSFVH